MLLRMHNERINSELRTVQHLIKLTTDSDMIPELQGYWSQYLCIRAAVLLEIGLRAIYSDYVIQSASQQTAAYVTRQLERVTNPQSSRFLDIAGQFDQQWKESLATYLRSDDGARRNAIDTIMTNRNSIAHGRPSTITIREVEGYLIRGVEVLEFIEQQCLTELDDNS